MPADKPSSVLRETRRTIPHRAIKFIFDNSLLLLAGTETAVAWANLEYASYDRIAHSLHFWVDDVGIIFFFALAAKEVFEATLPNGPLASPRRALSLFAAPSGPISLRRSAGL